MEISLYEPIEGATARQFVNAVKAAKGPITVAINSGGGNINDGFAIYNTLRAYKGHTVARIDGIAASMATIVALGADRVEMADNGWWMIHNPWGVSAGEADKMRKQADIMEQMGKAMLATYVAKTGLPEDEIKAMMDAETWLTAEEAKEKGFVDAVYPGGEEVMGLSGSCFAMLGKFQHPPVQLTTQQSSAAELAEAGRVKAVADLFSVFGNGGQAETPEIKELKASCISDNTCTPELARQRILAKLAEGIEPLGGAYAHIHPGNGNIVGDSIRAAINTRLGRQEPEKDNRYNNYSLREMARASLQDRNISCSSLNTMQMVGLAFTHSTSDFGHILGDVATKSALAGWNESPETFDQWTRTGSLPDFRPGHRVGLDTFPRLREVREGAEYKYATLTDTGATIMLATYGELFSITRQAIINDDLSVLSTIPMAMGRAAKATEGDLVYEVLTSNPTFNKEKLFSAKRNNLVSGALSVDMLSAARAHMRKQKSAGGQVLNIIPKYLLVPADLEAMAEQVIRSISIPGTNNAGVHNPVKDTLDIITEPRLDASSVDAWYLAAAKGADTIEVAYLDGIAEPYLESTQGFTVDGVTYKVRIDAGVAPVDYRGLLMSTGVDADA